MIVAKVSGVNLPSHPPQTLSALQGRRGRSLRQGWWKDSLLKLPEPRQARQYLHDAQHLPVLELVVPKTVGRPRPSPSAPGLRDLGAPGGRRQALPSSCRRHKIGAYEKFVVSSRPS